MQYMAKLVVKNGHQQAMCYNESGLYAWNIYLLASRWNQNMIGRAYIVT